MHEKAGNYMSLILITWQDIHKLSGKIRYAHDVRAYDDMNLSTHSSLQVLRETEYTHIHTHSWLSQSSFVQHVSIKRFPQTAFSQLLNQIKQMQVEYQRKVSKKFKFQCIILIIDDNTTQSFGSG